MAFLWANVLVAPTSSSGQTSGNHTNVDEDPPWSDADVASDLATSGATVTSTMGGFDLSNAGGEKEGFYIWLRMSSSNALGFSVTMTVKQDSTTLWTSSAFTMAHTAYRTYLIKIPDSSFVGSDIDNLSIDFSCVNNAAANNSFRISWLRISKSPFTTAQKAVLPSPLAGQEFVCYRASDIGVLGGVDGETMILIPDASGGGRHAVLVAGTAATYETDSPEGWLTAGGRYVGALGYDVAAGAPIKWTGNKIFHGRVYPTTLSTDHVAFSVDNTDFIGGGGSANKHILGVQSAVDWVLMSGDGSGAAHKAGGSPTINTEWRLTEWIQMSGGNEKMWENDDASPIIDASSGDNPFGFWSIFQRESDNRPWVGRIMELWFIDGTGITESEIDTSRDQWVNGIPEPQTLSGTLFTKAPTFFTSVVSTTTLLAGSIFPRAPTFFTGSISARFTLAGVFFQKAPTFPTGLMIPDQLISGSLFTKAPTYPTGTLTALSVTVGRVSRLSMEILSTNPNPGARVSRLSFESLSQNPNPVGRVSRLSFESLQSLTIVLPQDVNGVLFVRTVTFFTGQASQTNTIAGTLFQRSSTFFIGVVTSNRVLSGALFQRTPTFPTGALTTSITVSGSSFQRAPTFFTGAVTVGAATIGGALFNKAPTFFIGGVANPGIIAGALFIKSLAFPTGVVNTIYTVSGALFTKAPAFFTGNAQRQLVGSLFIKAPAFFTGNVQTVQPGVLFQTTPTFFTGAVTASFTLAGVLFQRTPIFPAGSFSTGGITISGNPYLIPPTFIGGFLTAINNVQGQLFVRTATFFTGNVGGATQTPTGVLFINTATFFVGAVIRTSRGTLFTKAPTFFVGALIQDRFLVGILFQKNLTFFTAAAVTETAIYIRMATRKQDLTWITDRP